MRAPRALLCLVGALLLAGCGSPRADGFGTDAATPTVTVGTDEGRTQDALALVGNWTVKGEGVPPDTVLALGDDAVVSQQCGLYFLDWAADGEQHLFVASSSAGDGECRPSPDAAGLRWLTGATGFALDGSDRRLLARDGGTLAVLRPGGVVPTSSTRVDSFSAERTISPQRRASAVEPARLSAGVTAPEAGDLAGGWVPRGTGAGNGKARVTFAPDGSYEAFDGCNGSAGRYVLGGDGRYLATSGSSTLIGCDNSPLPGWVATAARVGLAGDDLVLYDADGAELGRVGRA